MAPHLTVVTIRGLFEIEYKDFRQYFTWRPFRTFIRRELSENAIHNLFALKQHEIYESVYNFESFAANMHTVTTNFDLLKQLQKFYIEHYFELSYIPPFPLGPLCNLVYHSGLQCFLFRGRNCKFGCHVM
jgi:hypothetical protein